MINGVRGISCLFKRHVLYKRLFSILLKVNHDKHESFDNGLS